MPNDPVVSDEEASVKPENTKSCCHPFGFSVDALGETTCLECGATLLVISNEECDALIESCADPRWSLCIDDQRKLVRAAVKRGLEMAAYRLKGVPDIVMREEILALAARVEKDGR